jgi:hypothetical protein
MPYLQSLHEYATTGGVSPSYMLSNKTILLKIHENKIIYSTKYMYVMSVWKISPSLKGNTADKKTIHLMFTNYCPTPYVFMTWLLVKCRIGLHGMVLSEVQGQLYLTSRNDCKMDVKMGKY